MRCRTHQQACEGADCLLVRAALQEVPHHVHTWVYRWACSAFDKTLQPERSAKQRGRR